MTVLVVLTVIVIVLLIAGLAVYLYWAGTLLDRIGGKLEGAADIVRGIVADAKLIGPGVEHINETGGVVAGALPLLYGMAEGIVAGVTPRAPEPDVPEPARPASGTRRSRLLSGVGYRPELSGTYPADSPHLSALGKGRIRQAAGSHGLGSRHARSAAVERGGLCRAGDRRDAGGGTPVESPSDGGAVAGDLLLPHRRGGGGSPVVGGSGWP